MTLATVEVTREATSRRAAPAQARAVHDPWRAAPIRLHGRRAAQRWRACGRRLRLPSAIYPELAFSRVTIVVQGTSLGARQVLFSITRPIEEAVSIVPGVTRVQSRSIRGGSETNVTFAPRTDMIVALQQVQARVNQVTADLPARRSTSKSSE